VLEDLDGEIDLLIDSGPTSVGLESTVVDLTGATPRVLRPGPVSKAELEAALGGGPVLEQAMRASVARPMSPGQMAVHDAPRTPAYHVDSLEQLAGFDLKADVALILVGKHLTRGQHLAADQFVLESPANASHALYDVLHRCDALRKAAIVVVLPDDLPEWRAVRDRLMRACRPLAAKN
jgi:L-threonylcarbamoyladenylate synthase